MKKKFDFVFLTVFGAIFSLFVGPAFSEPHLSIATEGNLPPYNFTRPDGTLDGFEIELGNYLCNHMNVKCTFVTQPFDGLISGLNVGKFDAIMAGLTATFLRERVIDFSTAYLLTPQVFGTLKGSRYDALPHKGETFYLSADRSISKDIIKELVGAMDGAVVGITAGSIAENFVKEYFPDAFKVRRYKFVDDAILDLMSGRIDAIVNSRAVLEGAANIPGNQNLTFSGPFFRGGILGRGVGVGIRKGNPELLNKFNEAISSAKSDGTIKKLSVKWFGFDVAP